MYISDLKLISSCFITLDSWVWVLWPITFNLWLRSAVGWTTIVPFVDTSSLSGQDSFIYTSFKFFFVFLILSSVFSFIFIFPCNCLCFFLLFIHFVLHLLLLIFLFLYHSSRGLMSLHRFYLTLHRHFLFSLEFYTLII
jgi:hypothetical protein